MRKILIEGMSDNLGGVETFIHTLYQVLKENWRIDFITVNNPIPFEHEFLENKSHIFRITPRYKSIKNFCADIDKVFADNEYDVFWSNKTTLSSIYTLKSAYKNNVKKIICHSHSSKNMGFVTTYWLHTFNSFLVSHYINDKVACSRVAADYFFGKNASDVKIINNVVDIKKYEPNEIKHIEIKNKLGLDNKFVIGHVARFSPEKNHKFVIELFAKLLEKQQDAHLLLCGDGALLEDIKSLVKQKGIENKVSFLGSRNDMPYIYQAIDVLLLPSLFEGLPFTLVEAQASGIPCIVSDNVSKGTKLTDIIDFLNLDSDISEWINKILYYKDYKKISKSKMLEEKGFTMESLRNTVSELLG